MFSQRKSFWRRPWVTIMVVGVLGLGYWFSQSTNLNSDIKDSVKEPIYENIDLETIKPNKANPNVKNNQSNNQNLDSNESRGYFIVKKVGDAIEVYYYKGKEEPVFIKSTDISFHLLGEGDQALFTEGIVIETEEELNELLQDFGS